MHMKDLQGILCFDLSHNLEHSRCSVNECKKKKKRGKSAVGPAETQFSCFPRTRFLNFQNFIFYYCLSSPRIELTIKKCREYWVSFSLPVIISSNQDVVSRVASTVNHPLPSFETS